MVSAALIFLLFAFGAVVTLVALLAIWADEFKH